MTFYEISITTLEGTEEVLWSSEGVQIVEPATPGFREVRTLRLACEESFSDEAALRAFKKITGMISPEILELDGFDELDIAEGSAGGFTKQALALMILGAVKRGHWNRFTTLSLVNCNFLQSYFLQSYERKALSMLFKAMPARVRTLKLSGEMALEFDVFDPFTVTNVPRLPLNFDVIDMSDLHAFQVDEISAFTEAFLSRCMLRDGIHADRSTPARIIYPADFADMETNDSLDEIFLETSMPCCFRASILVAETAVPVVGPPEQYMDNDAALTFALTEHLRDHLRTNGLYHAGFVQLFEHMIHDQGGEVWVTRLAPTPDEFAVTVIFLAHVLAAADATQDVYAAVVRETEGSLKGIVESAPTRDVLGLYIATSGLTTPEAVASLLPAWTDEIAARWTQILTNPNAARVLLDICAIGHPHSRARTALWAVNPLNIDLVNAPKHFAQVRAYFRAFRRWHHTKRVINAIARASHRDLTTPAGAGAPRTIDTLTAVTVVQQWMMHV